MAEALHAPALVVDGDHQVRRAQLADRVRELDQLQRRGEVAREEDHAAHLRVLQALDVVGRELEAGDVHHHGSEPHADRLALSSTTKATATSASSVSETCEPRDAAARARWRAIAASGTMQRLAARVAADARSLCQVKGAWMPVPIAFEKASFAAKRLARWLGLVARALEARALLRA